MSLFICLVLQAKYNSPEFYGVSGRVLTLAAMLQDQVRVRAELIGHLKPCMPEIYLRTLCAHGRLYPHAPVDGLICVITSACLLLF